MGRADRSETAALDGAREARQWGGVQFRPHSARVARPLRRRSHLGSGHRASDRWGDSGRGPGGDRGDVVRRAGDRAGRRGGHPDRGRARPAIVAGISLPGAVGGVGRVGRRLARRPGGRGGARDSGSPPRSTTGNSRRSRFRWTLGSPRPTPRGRATSGPGTPPPGRANWPRRRDRSIRCVGESVGTCTKVIQMTSLLLGLCLPTPLMAAPCQEKVSLHNGKSLADWVKALDRPGKGARVEALKALGEIRPAAVGAVPNVSAASRASCSTASGTARPSPPWASAAGPASGSTSAWPSDERCSAPRFLSEDRQSAAYTITACPT